ncbi:hypothetical protein BDDG_08401 [Blastomyces dermatitidis ATCC 18188]|uniref:Uncharacterized protein n=1 Tax=Ajellomyces dermatitidis (strain ATCC 18188 / CBS 674.68) TaxID=653446 RepID=F2TQE3_AJEDA|nr:hypothetical protein BDDG_08401 [Blastomyces dermatitidis ATCC 18188]
MLLAEKSSPPRQAVFLTLIPIHPYTIPHPPLALHQCPAELLVHTRDVPALTRLPVGYRWSSDCNNRQPGKRSGQKSNKTRELPGPCRAETNGLHPSTPIPKARTRNCAADIMSVVVAVAFPGFKWVSNIHDSIC